MLPRPPIMLLRVCRSARAFVRCFVLAGDWSRVHSFREAHDVSARRSGRASRPCVAVRGAGIRKWRAEAEERVGQVRERVGPECGVRVAHEEILMHTGDASPKAGLILTDRVNGEYCVG